MLWYTSFRALFRACERPTYEWEREGRSAEEEEELGLLSQRNNTERGEGSMPNNVQSRRKTGYRELSFLIFRHNQVAK